MRIGGLKKFRQAECEAIWTLSIRHSGARVKRVSPETIVPHEWLGNGFSGAQLRTIACAWRRIPE